jgi:hypothetical protein
MTNQPCADCRRNPMESSQLGVCAPCFARRTKSCCEALPIDASMEYCVGYVRGYLYAGSIATRELADHEPEWRRGYEDGRGARLALAV